MRILYYAPNPQLSIHAQTGYGTHMREMINEWRQMGHDVETLIAGDLGKSNTSRKEESPSLLKNAVKKFIPAYLWESLKDRQLIRFDYHLDEVLNKRIKSFEPDLIYERVSYLQKSGIEIAKKTGVKHVSEVNAPFPEERTYFSGKSAYLKRAKSIEYQILEESNCLTVVSSALKTYLTEIKPSSEKKIHVIPNAVNPILRRSNEKKILELRSHYNPDRQIVVGFVGSIFPYHGVDLLIKAFKRTLKNAVLLVVGDGKSIPELKKFTALNGLDKRVYFTGSVPHDEVFHYIEIMDICCMMNSNWYGSPVKIFEYGLMNKAVIAPDVKPVRDVMLHEEDGLLVKESMSDICHSLERLALNKELRMKLAKSWNEKVLENYTWHSAAKKTLELCT